MPIGQDIDIGGPSNYISDQAVSINAHGNIFATASMPHNNYSGRVRVWKWSEEQGQWLQLGQDFDGEADHNNFGWSMDLNSDGNILAIGAPGPLTGDPDWAKVQVWEWKSEQTIWMQKGQVCCVFLGELMPP